ncbi:peroxiredoxin-5, mitochondrial-like isoform X2 [Ostrea edulis]|uniref:peroxiredoxin-5, mitochondrial-like isoform X2 n=1 Tax=Ostrea edulis TaxID=37623 RepID=UPI0024AEE2EE|nr:peroxiredoxin-5, mitochondrial-like isoform X2 [Ostrea edulis]
MKGERIPSVDLYEDSPAEPLNAQELFKGKKGVLFAVVGAFTPGCSEKHIPEYLNNYDKFKEEGYDMICCLAVNDPFVMSAWGDKLKTRGKIRMLADPQGKFTKAMKMDLDCTKLLGNIRSKRYALVIEDSVIKSINTEPDHTGLACLLCIRNFRSSPSVNAT